MNIVRAMTTKILMIGLILMAGVGVCEAKYKLKIYDIERFTTCTLEFDKDYLSIGDLKRALSILGTILTTAGDPDNLTNDFKITTYFGSPKVEDLTKELNLNKLHQWGQEPHWNSWDLLPEEFYLRLPQGVKGGGKALNDTTLLKDVIGIDDNSNRLQLIRYGLESNTLYLLKEKYTVTAAITNVSKAIAWHVCCSCRVMPWDEKNRISKELLISLNEGTLTLDGIHLLMGKYNHPYNRKDVIRHALTQLKNLEKRAQLYDIFRGIPQRTNEGQSSRLALEATPECTTAVMVGNPYDPLVSQIVQSFRESKSAKKNQ